MITAKIIADSINSSGNRLITYVCTYPRYIHSELGTHRAFSRNSASSRAIPVWKMLNAVYNEPVIPIHWGQNCKGMQAKGELPNHRKWIAEKIWRFASLTQITSAWILSKLGVHKQVTNRLIEPFAHITTIITASEWGNFFNLRAHPDAQPEFQELAYKMLDAYLASTPKKLEDYEWHLPFADQYMSEGLSVEELVKIVTARCARVSYLNFEGNIDHKKDYDLHDDLLRSGHMSPFEHAAMTLPLDMCNACGGNLTGYCQYRKLLQNENKKDFDPLTILARRK